MTSSLSTAPSSPATRCRPMPSPTVGWCNCSAGASSSGCSNRELPRLRKADFHVDGEITTRAVKDRYGVDFVVAPRRHVLDPLLQEAATQRRRPDPHRNHRQRRPPRRRRSGRRVAGRDTTRSTRSAGPDRRRRRRPEVPRRPLGRRAGSRAATVASRAALPLRPRRLAGHRVPLQRRRLRRGVPHPRRRGVSG